MTHSTLSRAPAIALNGERPDKLFQRVTKSFLRSLTIDPLGSITFLDLSRCGLKRITGIAACPNIEIVIANGNEIDTLIDLSGCRHLWKLDVSCNELKDLCGFERFSSFGTLIASCNQLNWHELTKICHLEILSLCLAGNNDLEKDPNYRKHVVKCLPKIWSLDGELVTSDERCKADRFFKQTEKSRKPVRMKLSCNHFVPSFRRQGSDVTVYGKRTTGLCRLFGKNETHNKDLDSRRLQFLCDNFHVDFVLESCNKTTVDLMRECLAMRETSVDKWNTFILLAMSSLVFSIPTVLMTSALQVIGMSNDELITCSGIVNLLCQPRTNVTSLLFSSLKLHGLGKGITAQLYETMQNVNMNLMKVAYGDSDVKIQTQHEHVLAAELAQIFCLVPHFSSYLDDISVTRILAAATLKENIDHELRSFLCKCETYKAREKLAEYITLQICEAKKKSYFMHGHYLKDEKLSSNMSESNFELPDSFRARPSTAPPSFLREKHGISPAVGDKVLLGPQRLGHIISNPDAQLVLVQVDSLSAQRYLQADYVQQPGNKQSLFYIKKADLVWEGRFESWIVNSVGQGTKSPGIARGGDPMLKRPAISHLTLHKEPSQVIQRSRSTIPAVEDQRALNSTNLMKDRFSSKSRNKLKVNQRKTPLLPNDYDTETLVSSLDTGEKATSKSQSLSDFLPVEVNLSDMGDEYQPVFQANAYHLYYIDKTRYSAPSLKGKRRSKIFNTQHTDNSFIRKSNWFNSAV